MRAAPDPAPGAPPGAPLLDALDRRILAELQADAGITNAELARRVGLSAPPCLRRVRALEEAGVIRGYRARLDPAALGQGVEFFAFVHLASQAEGDLAAFEARARALPPVRAAWTLSGDVDYLLRGLAPDLPAFQRFVMELTALPNVRNVRSALALSQVKDEPLVPIAPGPPREGPATGGGA